MMESYSRLEAARRARGWTLAVASQKIGVHPRTLRRWETGKSKPQGFRVYKISEIYETTPTALGIGSEHQQLPSPPPAPASLEQYPLLAHLAESLLSIEDLDLQLMNLILQHKLARQDSNYWTFQRQIDQYIREYDEYAQTRQNDSLTDARRQQAFLIIASIPLTVYLENISPGKLPAPPEDILTHCASAIAVCWHMNQRTDFKLAHSFVGGYLLLLLEVFEHAPHCRQATAELIAQACLLRSLLALRFDNPWIDMKSYARALKFSRVADTAEWTAVPLIQSRVPYGRQLAQALRTQTEALWLLKPSMIRLEPPPSRARLHDMDWVETALHSSFPHLVSERESLGIRDAYHLMQFLLPDDSIANAGELKDLLKTHD